MTASAWRRRRLERRALALTDEVVALRRDRDLLEAELAEHRRLHDDARLEALDGDADDRAAFAEIAGDVARFERALASLGERIDHVDGRRLAMLDRLG